ncbi:mucin-2-like [Dreissena polymorpha]|uniref:Uncharacterized protein n=1 Tax=Dreissena polymorpha TaxID=45954 RepID=A0A9D4FKU6_DREPO|nr:mucin-2-like [Dreissena polymorpha]KAH3799831.1 hypothetical protein DPMN_153447 [Dreissena polymorpha]
MNFAWNIIWILPIAWLVIAGSEAKCAGGDTSAHSSGGESVRDLFRRDVHVSPDTMCCICMDTVDMACTDDPRCSKSIKGCTAPTICSTTVYNNGTRILFSKQCLSQIDCINQWVNTSRTTPGCAQQDYSQIPVGLYCTYCCENEDPLNVHYCLDHTLSFPGQQNYSFPPLTASRPPTTTTSPPVKSTTSVHTKPTHTSHHLSPTGSSLTTQCEECDGASCGQSSVVTCNAYESFCLNVLLVDKHGNFSIIKKGCSSRYECLYDHSHLHADPCDFRGIPGTPSFAPGTERLCQFCCDGTGMSGPCNTQPVPQNTIDFDPSVTQTTTLGTPATTQTTTLSTPAITQTTTLGAPATTQTTTLGTPSNTQTTTLGTPSTTQTTTQGTPATTLTTTLGTPANTQTTTLGTPAKTQTTTLGTLSNSSTPITQNTTMDTALNNSTPHTQTTELTPPTHHNAIPHTHPASTQGISTITHITQPGVNTTVMPSSSSTTRRTTTPPAPGHYTLPQVATQCAVCMGPPEICEQLTRIVPCNPPNNYCINTIHNRVDGTRSVNRTCGNIDTCYRDWYVGTSDNDKCQEFSQLRAYTVEFDCTFCCVTNKCNLLLKPPDDTLYQDKRN